MKRNSFLKQEATVEIISNVADFCSECYTTLAPLEIIYYDMHNYRFICASCQEEIELHLDENCNPMDEDHSLFG